MKVSPEVLEKARHVGWLTALGTWSTGVIIEAAIDSLPEPESANALKAENERLKAQVEPLDNENTCLSAQLGELNQELLRAHAENEKHEEREKVLLVLLGQWYKWSDGLWDSAVEKGSLLASETRAALAEKEKEKA